MGVFDQYEVSNFPYRYEGTLHLEDIAGGVPASRDVLEYHLRTKASTEVTEHDIALMVEDIMAEREGVSREAAFDEAVSKYANERGLTRFRSDPEHGLWIPGNNLKACIKEAGNIAVNSDRLKGRGWGTTKKGWNSWCAEHIFVVENRLYFDREEADDVRVSFPEVRSPRGPMRAIKYTEVLENVELDFTVECDVQLPEKDWAAIWTTAQRIGLGADRTHYGDFEVTRWERVRVGTDAEVRAVA